MRRSFFVRICLFIFCSSYCTHTTHDIRHTSTRTSTRTHTHTRVHTRSKRDRATRTAFSASQHPASCVWGSHGVLMGLSTPSVRCGYDCEALGKQGSFAEKMSEISYFSLQVYLTHSDFFLKKKELLITCFAKETSNRGFNDNILYLIEY